MDLLEEMAKCILCCVTIEGRKHVNDHCRKCLGLDSGIDHAKDLPPLRMEPIPNKVLGLHHPYSFEYWMKELERKEDK